MIWNTTSSNIPQYNNTLSNTSNLVRLVEDNSVVKNIQLDELSIVHNSQVPDADGGQQQIQVAGIEYPMIRINDFVFSKQHIYKFSIDCSNFVPTISLVLNLSNTNFITKSMPKDGDIVSTYIRTNTNALTFLRNDFIIISCSSNIGSTTGTSIVYITGRLFINKFDAQSTFGIIGTSKYAIRESAKKFNLGFSFNDYDDTDDFQNWVCANMDMETYLTNIITRSWKDELSFFKVWVDLYYNICFVNINKFLLSNENTENEIDITYRTNTLNIQELYYQSQDKSNALPTLKILSNRGDYKGTPFYITDWNPVNNSSLISINTGYESDTYTLIHNQNLYNTNKEKCFEILRNFPAYDINKLNNYILLRGRTKYDKKNNTNEQERINYDYVNTYTNTGFAGVEYMIDTNEKTHTSNNIWSGNMHKNYMRSGEHNNINISELDKLYINVTCEGLCLQIMKGERIPVYIVYNSQTDGAVNNISENNINPDNTIINRFYSGFYIVDSITYNYSTNKSAYSNFSTDFVLKRREWPSPEKII